MKDGSGGVGWGRGDGEAVDPYPRSVCDDSSKLKCSVTWQALDGLLAYHRTWNISSRLLVHVSF